MLASFEPQVVLRYHFRFLSGRRSEGKGLPVEGSGKVTEDRMLRPLELSLTSAASAKKVVQVVSPAFNVITTSTLASQPAMVISPAYHFKSG